MEMEWKQVADFTQNQSSLMDHKILFQTLYLHLHTFTLISE